MKRLVIIVFVLFFVTTGDLFTQEKDVKIIGKASNEFSDIVYRTARAVIIGINKYPNVPQLEYAVP